MPRGTIDYLVGVRISGRSDSCSLLHGDVEVVPDRLWACVHGRSLVAGSIGHAARRNGCLCVGEEARHADANLGGQGHRRNGGHQKEAHALLHSDGNLGRNTRDRVHLHPRVQARVIAVTGNQSPYCSTSASNANLRSGGKKLASIEFAASSRI